MHIRDTKEFLEKVDYLKDVFGEKSRTKAMARAVSLVHNLSGGQGVDAVSNDGIHNLISSRLDVMKVSDTVKASSRELSGFIYSLFRYSFRAASIEKPVDKIVHAMKRSGFLDDPDLRFNINCTDVNQHLIYFNKTEDGLTIIIDGMTISSAVIMNNVVRTSDSSAVSREYFVSEHVSAFIESVQRKTAMPCIAVGTTALSYIVDKLSEASFPGSIPKEERVLLARVQEMSDEANGGEPQIFKDEINLVIELAKECMGVKYIPSNIDQLTLLNSAMIGRV